MSRKYTRKEINALLMACDGINRPDVKCWVGIVKQLLASVDCWEKVAANLMSECGGGKRDRFNE